MSEMLNLLGLDKCERDSIRSTLEVYPFLSESCAGEIVYVFRDMLESGIGAEEASQMILRMMDIMKNELGG